MSTVEEIDLETATPAQLRRLLRPEPVVRTVERRRPDGSVVDIVGLEPSIFGIEPNLDVLHQVVTAQLAAARSGTQSTKTRAEVRGGGTKPFRQKGTGRARAGSTRSPIWIGGGVALGPKPRSYAQRTPKKMVRLALRSALSDRAAEGRVALVDDWYFEVPRTKDAVAALEALDLDGRVLVVLGPDDGFADRSFANLPHVQTIVVGELNAYDILVNDWIVFTNATLPGAEVTVTIEIDEDVTADGEVEAVAVVEVVEVEGEVEAVEVEIIEADDDTDDADETDETDDDEADDDGEDQS